MTRAASKLRKTAAVVDTEDAGDIEKWDFEAVSFILYLFPFSFLYFPLTGLLQILLA